MKPFVRLTHRASFRAGTIVLGAMMYLALASTSADRMALPVLAATAIGVASATPAAAETNDTAIRPFRVNVPDATLADLRKRVLATRWPEKETVNDRSQGVQLAKLQELVRYWGTDYDWRKVEAKLNSCLSSSRRSTGSTFTSSTSALVIRMPWQSSSLMAGRVPSRSSSRSLVRSQTPRHTADPRRTPLMSSSPRCPALASPASRQPRAGTLIASRELGQN